MKSGGLLTRFQFHTFWLLVVYNAFVGSLREHKKLELFQE